jgi:hypothetical protein
MATTCLAQNPQIASTYPAAPVPRLSAGIGRGGPPLQPRQASGFSGRPFCRIYPSGNGWVLEAVRGFWVTHETQRKTLSFPSLTAAIAYAVTHGFSYRVVHAHGDAEDGRTASLNCAPLPFMKNFRKGIDRQKDAPRS